MHYIREKILNYLHHSQNCRILLTKDITEIFPQPEEHLEPPKILHVPNGDQDAYGEILCAIDFSNYEEYERSVNFSFRDLISRNIEPECPLSILNYANILLKDDGVLATFPINANPRLDIIEKFLKCAKFFDIKYEGGLILAKKKKLRKYLFDHGRLTFEETNSPEMIKYIQYFAKGLFKDNNFDFSIDDIFAPHSDFYVCYRTETKEIVSFLRYTWYLPGHPLPCMLATAREDGEHIKLDNPEREIYGELFAPYINTISAVKSYKELVKNILDHCLNIGATKVFTTYNKAEPISGEFFSKIFGFKDTNTILHYGDFGGEWGLLIGGKIDSLPIAKIFAGAKSEE